jgi:hypothetical protein
MFLMRSHSEQSVSSYRYKKWHAMRLDQKETALPAPLPRSPFDQHEPSVLAHPPPGKIHLVDLELEQRQALGFAHSICTDCVSMVTMR